MITQNSFQTISAGNISELERLLNEKLPKLLSKNVSIVVDAALDPCITSNNLKAFRLLLKVMDDGKFRHPQFGQASLIKSIE